MKLIFVYNADSGKINTLLDIGHKILRPDTYSCNLCSLTHGVFSEKEEWRQYRAATGHELEFFHKDEFEEHYGREHGYTYPVILTTADDNSFEVLMSTEAINALSGIEELVSRLPRE